MLPTLNEPLIDQVLDKIEADLKHWDQGSYGVQTACGTSYCFAGWAAVLSPEVSLVWSQEIFFSVITQAFQPESPVFADAVALPDGTIDQVHFWARDALGLTHSEASALFFYFGADLHKVYELLNEFRANRGLSPTARTPLTQAHLDLAGGPTS